MGWYIVITDEIQATGLTGNALLVYAAVAGYSRNGNGLYVGGSRKIATALGLPDRSVRRYLSQLVDDGLLEVTTVVVYGEPRRAYRTAQQGVGQNGPEVGQNGPGVGQIVPPVPPIPPAPPITPITQNNNIPPRTTTWCSTPKGDAASQAGPKKSIFKAPKAEEVRGYWVAERLNGNPDEFYDHFEANGWKVGGTSPMKDWRAAARNWSRREVKVGRRAPAKQETFLDAARRTAQRLGIAPEAYTTKTPYYDEQ